MSTVVDFFAAHDRAFYDCLVQNEVSGIARYLTNSMNDARELTVKEVADAHGAGLAIYCVYEMSPTYAAYFTFAQGAEDCRQAVDRLRDLGAPQGTVVYFAIDTNVDPGLVDIYANGIESMATPHITPGIYGYQRMCEHARANYPKMGRHLWQTYGVQTGSLELWQHEQDALCGVSVDINEATVEGWRKDDDLALRDEFETYKRNTDTTIEAMKNTYNPLYHHVHLLGPITPLVSSEPLVPPLEGAKYAGDSADLVEVVWEYPDGTRHTWANGKEVIP